MVAKHQRDAAGAERFLEKVGFTCSWRASPAVILGVGRLPMRQSMTGEEFEEVLRFWFPQHLCDDHGAMVSQFEWWFGGGADASIVERFAPVLEQAIRGGTR
jgi:hypothetical protein